MRNIRSEARLEAVRADPEAQAVGQEQRHRLREAGTGEHAGRREHDTRDQGREAEIRHQVVAHLTRGGALAGEPEHRERHAAERGKAARQARGAPRRERQRQRRVRLVAPAEMSAASASRMAPAVIQRVSVGSRWVRSWTPTGSRRVEPASSGTTSRQTARGAERAPNHSENGASTTQISPTAAAGPTAAAATGTNTNREAEAGEAAHQPADERGEEQGGGRASSGRRVARSSDIGSHAPRGDDSSRSRAPGCFRRVHGTSRAGGAAFSRLDTGALRAGTVFRHDAGAARTHGKDT